MRLAYIPRFVQIIPASNTNYPRRTLSMKVTVNGTTIADSNETVVVENNHYFPPASVKSEFFSDSNTSTVCPWKGTASYYNANIDGKSIKDIAWYYPEAKEKAKNIQGYVAFYKNKVTFE